MVQLTDTSATEIDSTNAKGWYLFDVAQAESNADALLFTAKSTTANIVVRGDEVYTLPANFTTLSIDSGGVAKANLAQILGTAITETAGQIAAAFKQFFDVGTPTGTMKAITNVATVSSVTAIAAAERNAIADALLDRDMSVGTDSGSSTFRTPRQAFRMNRNKVLPSAGTLTVYKEDDATSSWSATYTTSASADPITSIDPAGP